MFGGDKLLERGEEIQNSQDHQKSNEPNVDGYLTGMAIGISVLFIPNKFQCNNSNFWYYVSEEKHENSPKGSYKRYQWNYVGIRQNSKCLELEVLKSAVVYQKYDFN